MKYMIAVLFILGLHGCGEDQASASSQVTENTAALLADNTELKGGSSGTRGGGTIVVDGTTYRLADLYFKPLPYAGYTFDQPIEEVLDDVKLISDKLRLGLEENFLKVHVYNPLVEYRFVAALPESCQFIPNENLPGGLKKLNVGCTEGYITYLIPGLFLKLSAQERALLILHERLHSVAPNQPYEIKTDFIRALHILLERYLPAFKNRNAQFEFSPEELNLVQVLRRRVHQLTGQNGLDRDYRSEITKTGALLVSHKDNPSPWKVDGQNIVIGIGTVLVNYPYIKDKGRFNQSLVHSEAVVSGKNFSLLNVTYVANEVSFPSKRLHGIDTLVRDSEIETSSDEISIHFNENQVSNVNLIVRSWRAYTSLEVYSGVILKNFKGLFFRGYNGRNPSRSYHDESRQYVLGSPTWKNIDGQNRCFRFSWNRNDKSLIELSSWSEFSHREILGICHY